MTDAVLVMIDVDMVENLPIVMAENLMVIGMAENPMVIGTARDPTAIVTVREASAAMTVRDLTATVTVRDPTATVTVRDLMAIVTTIMVVMATMLLVSVRMRTRMNPATKTDGIWAEDTNLAGIYED